MKSEKHKLTNRDIANEYGDAEFYLMISDFKGEFAKWVVKQDGSKNYHLQADAVKAYESHLRNARFETDDTVVKMNLTGVRALVNEELFCSIPEIYALNQVGNGFVDLGALERNVFYGILREQITQPL